jgi:hypothetical protein
VSMKICKRLVSLAKLVLSSGDWCLVDWCLQRYVRVGWCLPGFVLVGIGVSSRLVPTNNYKAYKEFLWFSPKRVST